MNPRLPRIGDLLVEVGALSPSQLAEALGHQRQHGGRIGTSLVALGFINERALAGILAKQLSIPSVSESQLERISQQVIGRVTPQVAERLRLVPVGEDQGRLWVAMSDPTDTRAIDEVTAAVGREVRPMVIPDRQLEAALERYYGIVPKVQPEVEAPGLYLNGDRLIDAGPLDPSAPSLAVVEEATGFLDEAPRPSVAATPRTSLAVLAGQMLAASNDDAVLDAVLRHLSPDAPRQCVFGVRSGEFEPWRALGVELSSFVGVHQPVNELPLVGRALSTADPYLGGLGAAELGQLAAPLGVDAETLGLILPVRIGHHPIGCLIALDVSLEVMRRKAELSRVARKLDQALHINYLRRLLIEP
jgi:hypothetical protein